jgi:hypothetical protein
LIIATTIRKALTVGRHHHRTPLVATALAGCLATAACGATADAAALAETLPATPGCEQPEPVGVTPEEAPIQDAFAAAVSASGVAVDSVSAGRPATGGTEECPDLVSVTVSGTGRDGADAEVQLVAWWSGDALRDVRCEGPSCLSSVQGSFTVFQVTADGESSVMYQPAEGAAGGGVATPGAWVVRSSGDGPAGEEPLQLAAVEYWADLLPPL